MTADNPTTEPVLRSDIEGSHHYEFDWAETEPSTAVVDAVTTAVNCGPMETEPLYDAIEPDALDAIVPGSSSTVTIQFTFDSHEVIVSSDGWVSVRPEPVGV